MDNGIKTRSFEAYKMDYLRSNKKIKAAWVLLWYRLGNFIYYSGIPSLIKQVLLIILKVCQFIFVIVPFSTEIPFKAKIGPGLRLSHTYGIVIHEDVVIGKNCNIFHFVTIGANETKGDFNVAEIGDNVYIGAGAKIIGNVVIGDNVKIGANATVVKDIEANTTVVCKSTII